MPEACLTLTLPEDTWIGEVTRRYPEATFTILAAVTDDDAGVGIAKITAGDLLSLVEDMTDHESLASVELLEYQGRTALVQFRTDEPMLLFAARGSGLPVEMPFDIQDGKAAWELTTTRETLSGLVEQLDMLGIPFEVEEVHEDVGVQESPLTDRQWTLVEAAVAEGYYDTPRRTTLTELADTVSIAKSTCSETLHRAEERIVKYFVENAHPPDDGTAVRA